jgi:hypothetical protein
VDLLEAWGRAVPKRESLRLGPSFFPIWERACQAP